MQHHDSVRAILAAYISFVHRQAAWWRPWYWSGAAPIAVIPRRRRQHWDESLADSVNLTCGNGRASPRRSLPVLGLPEQKPRGYGRRAWRSPTPILLTPLALANPINAGGSRGFWRRQTNIAPRPRGAGVRFPWAGESFFRCPLITRHFQRLGLASPEAPGPVPLILGGMTLRASL